MEDTFSPTAYSIRANLRHQRAFFLPQMSQKNADVSRVQLPDKPAYSIRANQTCKLPHRKSVSIRKSSIDPARNMFHSALTIVINSNIIIGMFNLSMPFIINNHIHRPVRF